MGRMMQPDPERVGRLAVQLYDVFREGCGQLGPLAEMPEATQQAWQRIARAALNHDSDPLVFALEQYADHGNWAGATGPGGLECSGWVGHGKGWEVAQRALP